MLHLLSMLVLHHIPPQQHPAVETVQYCKIQPYKSLIRFKQHNKLHGINQLQFKLFYQVIQHIILPVQVQLLTLD